MHSRTTRATGRHAAPQPHRRLLAGVLSLILGVGAALVGTALPAAAALGDQGAVTLTVTANDAAEAPGLEPGDALTYRFRVGCDDNACIDAALSNQLPAELAGFEITSLSVTPATAGNASLTGCSVDGTVSTGCRLDASFTQPLGTLGGTAVSGIAAGSTVYVTLGLTVPSTLPITWPSNGVPIDNQATASATNSDDATDSASATVTVPVVVSTDATKSWQPTTQGYTPGSTSTVRLGAANTSTVPASTLVLQDPVGATDGASQLAASNPFTRVDLVGLCSPSSLPQGADLVQVDAYLEQTPGTWQWVTGSPAASATLPALAAADPSGVGGLRFTWTSSTGATIAAAGTAGAVCLTVEQRSTHRTTGASLVTGGSVSNTAQATVTVPGQPAATDSATASLTVTPLTVSVQASKSITPAQVAAGDTFSTVLTAKNTASDPLTSLTIHEPGSGGAFLSDDLTLAGFTALTWPSGATAAELTYTFSDGTTQTLSLVNGALPAAPTIPSGEHVTGFDVTWTGTIAAGTTASAAFDVATSVTTVPSAAQGSLTLTNTTTVTGTNAAGTASAPASADIAVYYPTLAVQLAKTMRPAQAVPGGTVLAELLATTSSPTPVVKPTTIVVEDVWDGTPGAFWDAFRAKEITFTDVPAGSTLTVEAATGTPPSLSWTTIGTAGPGLYSTPLTGGASIVGLRFTFTNPAGFAQGSAVQPNILFDAAATLRTGGATSVVDAAATSYTNAAVVTGTAVVPGMGTLTDTDSDAATSSVRSWSGAAGLVPAKKRWVSPSTTTDLNTLSSQSGANAWSILNWGAAVPGYSSLRVSDTLPGEETTPGATVFNAFDLRSIQPVTFVQDPLLRWDVVTSVQLFNGSAWQTVTPPSGGWMSTSGFRGYTLTAAESASTTGVVVTVAENSAARTASTDPTRPAPGSGVASSATARSLTLAWTLRNTTRDAAAAGSSWVTANATLSGGTGVVSNTYQVAATPLAGGSDDTTQASDSLTLLNPQPNVSATKTASPTSITVPRIGDVPAASYPTVTFTLDATNRATSRATAIRVADPCDASCVTTAATTGPDVFTSSTYAPATNTFERFTLTKIAFTIPNGVPVDTSGTHVALWHRADDGTLSVTTTTMAAAAALPASALVDVVGVSTVWTTADPATTGGLLTTSAVLRTVLTTQLRTTLRSTGEPVLGGASVVNEITAQGFDPVLAPTATPNALAQASVALSGARLEATATKTITPATITEPQRNQTVTVRLTGTDGTSTASPQTVTFADTDTTFWSSFRLLALGAITLPDGADRVRVDVTTSAGPDWVLGTPGTTATLPAVTDLTTVTGVRYVFFRADGSVLSQTLPAADWSGSATFTVQLRDSVTFPASAGGPASTVANTATVTATRTGLTDATANATATATLTPGTARLDVRKDPEPTNHLTEPGVSVPWTLQLSNTGTGYLDVSTVVDNLGPYLRWDGVTPVITTSAGGTLPTTGVTVTTSGLSGLTLTFPSTARMKPGETATIRIGVVLQPGLTTGQRATNSFVVTTAQTLGTTGCVNTSGNGQGVLTGLAATECGTSNYVSPQSGALLLVDKAVKGARTGAVNTSDASAPCVDDGGWYRSPCAATTVVGGTDTWRVTATNSGTQPYSDLTIVEPLPLPGDRLLATGAARDSSYRPVFDGVVPVVDAPTGATWVWQVTTAAGVCTGSTGSSSWPSDPSCSSNPSGVTWTDGGSYTGDWSLVTGLRLVLDLSGTATGTLTPGQYVSMTYTTTNTPLATADAAPIAPQTTTPIAWGQAGAVATVDATGVQIRRAPVKAGVALAVGPLEVAKQVTGAGAGRAPATVTFTVQCTVSGHPVPLGTDARLAVPTGGSTRIDGLPVGATCTVEEAGALGTAGESSRSPQGAVTVQILDPAAADGSVPAAQRVTVTNGYTLLPLTPRPADPTGAVEGANPTDGTLATTGADRDELLRTAAAGLLLVLAGAAALLARRRLTPTGR